jgi:hypothetical protein
VTERPDLVGCARPSKPTARRCCTRIGHCAFLVMVTFLALCLPTAASAQVASSPNVGGMVEIRGEKNPADIPEYAMSRHVFARLSQIDKQNIQALKNGIPLLPADAALTYKAAHDAVAANERCLGRQEQIDRGRSLKDYQTAVQPLILGCRQDILDAAERLVARLTPEGAAILQTWALARRREITALVPRGELEFFRRPR